MSDGNLDSGGVAKSDEFFKTEAAQDCCYTNSDELVAGNYSHEMFSGVLNPTKTTIQDFVPSERVTVIKLRKDDTVYLSETKSLQQNDSEASVVSEKTPSPKHEAGEDSVREKNDQIFEERKDGYEFPDADSDDEVEGAFSAESMFNAKISSTVTAEDEIAEAVCNIPNSPNSLKPDYDDITCSVLCNKQTQSGASTYSCSMPSKVQLFTSPMFPPPRPRGRPLMSTLNVSKSVSKKYPGTPYPHIVPRSDRSNISHEQIPQWTLNKTIDLPQTPEMVQTPQAVDVVFTSSGDSGPIISSASSGVSSSSLTCSSSEQQNTSSSSLSDFLSPPFNVETFDVSASSDGVIQNLVSADGQPITQYENSSGILQYFIPVVNERENHNVKERKRRSRVSSACTAMRNMIPGMSEKTDKASVFEQAVEYVSFIKRKLGPQLDQAYMETLFQKT